MKNLATKKPLDLREVKNNQQPLSQLQLTIPT